MAGYLLTEATKATCPHGGQITFTASQDAVQADSSSVLLLGDDATISGCAFNVSGAPSPCTTIEWSLVTTRLTVNDTEVLLDSSIGQCQSAAYAPQGPVLISKVQQKVQAT